MKAARTSVASPPHRNVLYMFDMLAGQSIQQGYEQTQEQSEDATAGRVALNLQVGDIREEGMRSSDEPADRNRSSRKSGHQRRAFEDETCKDDRPHGSSVQGPAARVVRNP
jgi:hypothetical protein